MLFEILKWICIAYFATGVSVLMYLLLQKSDNKARHKLPDNAFVYKLAEIDSLLALLIVSTLWPAFLITCIRMTSHNEKDNK